MKRGAPAKRQRDLELPLLAVAERRDQRVAHVVEVDGVHDRFRLRHGARRRRAAASSEKRPRRNAAAGEKDGIADGEPAEQLRDLIGPPQPAPDPLMHRQRR